ncbi:MAG TPA: EpsI family protein [Candidatus Saccharimonadales bacterium]|nr:EpsI family protein [Candidatus Saccharimonadales bacterium]
MKLRLVTLLILVAAVGAWTHGLRGRQARTQHAADFDRVPAQVGTRTGVDESVGARTMEVLRADEVLSRLYRDPQDGSVLQLFVAYFGSQETGSQIHSPQNCLPGGGWRILDRRHWSIPTRSGSRAVNELVITKGEGGRQVVQYWFVTRSGVLSNEFALKWDLVRNSLLGLPTDAALVRLVLPEGRGGLDATRRELRAFCVTMQPLLDRAIPIVPVKDRLTASGARRTIAI